MPDFKVNQNGVWKTPTSISVNQNGVWKPVIDLWVNNNNVWTKVWPYTAYGTLLSTYCAGYDKFGTYADGTGGTYNSLIASFSVDCGYPPFEISFGSLELGAWQRKVGLTDYTSITGADPYGTFFVTIWIKPSNSSLYTLVSSNQQYNLDSVGGYYHTTTNLGVDPVIYGPGPWTWKIQFSMYNGSWIYYGTQHLP